MSRPIRWSISVDEETEQIGDSLQAEFAPIVGDNRSRLVQMIFKSWHRLGFTMETLATALSQAQRIKLANAAQSVAEINNLSQPEFPAQTFPVEGRAKPLTRIAPKVGVRGRAISHVSRMVSMATVPYGITSLSNDLRIHFTRRWAA